MSDDDFFPDIPGCEHLADVLSGRSWFEDEDRRDAFRTKLRDSCSETKESYNNLCSDYHFEGHIVPEEDIPASVSRLMHEHAVETMCTKWLQVKEFPWGAIQAASDSNETPEWTRIDEWINASYPEAVPDDEPVHLGKPSKGSVFATFREDDPPRDNEEMPGILADAVEEAQLGLPQQRIAERLAHRLALEWPWDGIEYAGLVWYDRDCYDCFRIPTVADGGTHRYFRPVEPGADTYGRTRPDLMRQDGWQCPLCPECSEAELVHENKPIPVRELWIALVRTER